MIDKGLIKELLGSKIYSRALDYYRRGLVEEFFNNQGDGEVNAVVRGSRGNFYHVEIYFDKKEEMIDAYCDCPYPDFCKHIGAVLLKYIELKKENNQDKRKNFFDGVNERAKPFNYNVILELKDKGEADHPIFQNIIFPQANKNKSAIYKKTAGEFRLIFTVEKEVTSYINYNYTSYGSRWVLKPALQYIKRNGEAGRVENYNFSKISYPITEKEYFLLLNIERYINNKAPFEYFIGFFLPDKAVLDDGKFGIPNPHEGKYPAERNNPPENNNLHVKTHLSENFNHSQNSQQQISTEMEHGKNVEVPPLYIKKGQYYEKLFFSRLKRTIVRFKFYSLLLNKDNEPLFRPEITFIGDNGESSRIVKVSNVGFSPEVFFIIDDEKNKILYTDKDPYYGKLIESLLALGREYKVSDIKKLEGIVNKHFSDFVTIEFPVKRVRVVSVKPKPVLVLKDVYEGLQIQMMFKYMCEPYKDETVKPMSFREEEISIVPAIKGRNTNSNGNKQIRYTRLIPYELKADILIMNKEEDGISEDKTTRNESSDEIVIAWRNMNYEKTISNYIYEMVERDISPYYSEYNRIRRYLGEDNREDESLVLEKSISHFISEYGERLISEGFEIWKDGKRVTRATRVVFTANWGIDWLDIKTELQSEDGNTFTFNPGSDDIVGNVLNTKDTYIIVDNSYIKKLKALHEHGLVKDDCIQLSKYNISIIDELYQDIKNRDEENIKNIKRVIDGLKNFDGIKHIEPPSGFNGSLRGYQKAGLSWLYFLHEYKLNGILADDMGLGKTIQVLALILTLKNERKFERALVVAPVSTLSNWMNEIKRFVPSLNAYIYHGSSLKEDLDNVFANDIVITSYATLRRNIKKITEYSFTYLILDEAQTIKNPVSKGYKSIKLINAKHRLSLTGTPVENSTIDLWAQMNFLNPGLLGSLTDFKRKFAKAIEKDRDTGKSELLKKMIFPFILRRKKEDVLKDLPPKEEIILYATMDKKQKRLYEEIRQFYKNKVQEKIDRNGLNRSAMFIFEALLKLRQAAILPSLVSQNYSNVPSCKFDLLKLKIEEIVSENHKALIFSQFLGSLLEIKKWVESSGIEYTYLDGSTPNRGKIIKEFQDNEAKKVFIISLKAGGLGINLTASNYVFLFDPWWNPAVEMQAVNRSHRIGQLNKVTIYKLITKDTIEEKILVLQEKKRELLNDIITTEKAFFKSLGKEEIMSLFESSA